MYLSGVEQRYVVVFSWASTTEDCLDSVVTISLPHTITPGGNSNPDSAPEGINATATAGNKVVTPEIKRPTGTTDGLVTYNLGTVAAGTSFQTVLTFTAPRGVTPGGSTVTPVATFSSGAIFSSGDTTVTANDSVTITSEPTPLLSKTGPVATPKNVDVTYQITPKYDTTVDGLNGKSNMTNDVVTDPLPCGMTYVEGSVTGCPAGKDKTVTVRDATGCTRQLVQVTWPGYQTKGGTTIQLRGKVGPSMSAGTHKNEAYISAAEPEYALTSKKTTICFYGSTDDAYDVNGDGNTADQVCPVSSTFTVSEQAGADVVLESLGSVPGSVYKKYTDGPSVMRQGEDGQFRITPTNSGNADLSDMTVYGILPHVGDTSVQGGASRNSEWEPTITGPIQIGTGSGIDPSQVTIEYSTSFNPCCGEVINQGDTMAASPAGCDNNWTATPASTRPRTRTALPTPCPVRLRSASTTSWSPA